MSDYSDSEKLYYEFDGAGVLAVAIAATISLISCTLLLFYTLYVYYEYLQYQPPSSFTRIDMEEKTVQKKRYPHFLSTQFGTMFLNLVLADLIQAIGMSLNYVWFGLKEIDSKSRVCLSQSVFMEIGDVGGALWSLLIGLHTFSCLVLRRQPSSTLLYITIAVIWISVIFVATVLPVMLETDQRGSFYGNAGGWCWITMNYTLERLLLQYSFIFTAMISNTILYSASFIILRRRRKVKSSPQEKFMERCARKSLGYPVAYIGLALPLSIYRLSQANGHTWPVQVLLAAGTIYALSGFVNIVIYGATRKIIRRRQNKRYSKIATDGI